MQALFGNLGTHKLGPQIEAHAEVLQAEAGEDTTKQVRRRCLFSGRLSHGWCFCKWTQFASSIATSLVVVFISRPQLARQFEQLRHSWTLPRHAPMAGRAPLPVCRV